jgi:hypothetical protein
MVTHEELKSFVYVSDCDYLMASCERNIGDVRLICRKSTINPEFVNLVCGAGVMYRTMTNQLEVMQNLVSNAHLLNKEDIAEILQSLIRTANLSLTYALAGSEEAIELAANLKAANQCAN